MPGTIQTFKNATYVAAIRNHFVLDGLIDHCVESFAIFSPLTGSAQNLFALLNLDWIERAGAVVGSVGFWRLRGIVELHRFDRGVLLEFALGIESPGNQVSGGRDRQFVVSEDYHRNQQFFRVVQLL